MSASNVHDDTRERVIRLEEQVRFLHLESVDTNAKVTELYNLMMQAKGARWVILAVGGFAGFAAGFLANAAKIWPWFASLPR